jgi:ketosteroid isomerase-like protein
MSRAEMEKAIHELYGARCSGDLKGAMGRFCSDSRFAISGNCDASPIALSIRGKPEIEQLLVNVFAAWEWQDQKFRDLIVDGDRAAVHYHLRARFTPTGEIVETDICDLLTFEGGQLKEIIQFLDTALVGRLIASAGNQSAHAA